MTDPTPLRTALDDLAASAPAAVLDVDGVRRRIRRRRRVRHGAYGGAAVLTTAAAGVSIAVVLTPGDGADTPAIATPVPAPVQQAFDALGCGSELRTHGPAPAAPLELEIDLAEAVEPGPEGSVMGTATITNTSDETITGSDVLETWIAQDGTVVTDPPPQEAIGRYLELAPGQSKTYPVFSFLRQCTSDGPSQPYQRPLEPGRYQVYVELRLLTETELGSLNLYSGPIDIEVR